MNKPPIYLVLGGALAFAGAVLLPRESSAQAAQADDPVLNKLIAEVAAQQVMLTENHTKIDEKLAAIAEDVRVARIYVARGGGKAK